MSIYKKSSYENLLQKLILEKYKMSNTFIYTDAQKNRLVKSIDMDDCLTTNWTLSAYSPAGGIVSNIQDMTKFTLAQYDTSYKELALTQIPTFKIDTTMQMGLGWHIIKSKIKHKVLFHNGATGNFTSSMSLDIDSKKGVIILSSASYSDTEGCMDKIGFAILKYLNTK
jgi:CubicO group peptidase (beta-lactamase class C family)